LSLDKACCCYLRPVTSKKARRLQPGQSTGRADRAKYAKERAEQLEPRLAYVTLVPDAVPTDYATWTITLDRTRRLSPSLLGQRIPLDPGPHRAIVEAEGRTPATFEFVASAAASETVVLRTGTAVPTLEKPAFAARPSGQLQPAPSSVWPYVVTGSITLVAASFGTYFGLHAAALNGRSNDLCGAASTCTRRDAINLRDEARDEALKSTLFFTGAAIALGTGVVVWLLSK
jgi:hypothetical protein